MSIWGTFLKNITKTDRLSLIKTIGHKPASIFRSVKPPVESSTAV